jgi:hypothetical protein
MSTSILMRGMVASAMLAFASMTAGYAYAQSAEPTKKPMAAAAKEQKPSATPSQSQSNDAEAILRRMAEFLGGTQRFSASVRSDYDAVQESGQKIEFGESRKVTLARPGQLRVEGESSNGAKVLVVFTGKEITLIDSAANVYATAPQPGGVDESIVHFVRDLGMRLPLAMLLVSQLPAELKARVRTLEYVEKTRVHGAPAHHIVGRTDDVDFQIWIADGDKPLPQRIVLTYVNAPGDPQFRAQFSDWNLAPNVTDATFQVKPPAKAQKVAFAAQLPRAVSGARKPDQKGAR